MDMKNNEITIAMFKLWGYGSRNRISAGRKRITRWHKEYIPGNRTRFRKAGLAATVWNSRAGIPRRFLDRLVINIHLLFLSCFNLSLIFRFTLNSLHYHYTTRLTKLNDRRPALPTVKSCRSKKRATKRSSNDSSARSDLPITNKKPRVGDPPMHVWNNDGVRSVRRQYRRSIPGRDQGSPLPGDASHRPPTTRVSFLPGEALSSFSLPAGLNTAQRENSAPGNGGGHQSRHRWDASQTASRANIFPFGVASLAQYRTYFPLCVSPSIWRFYSLGVRHKEPSTVESPRLTLLGVIYITKLPRPWRRGRTEASGCRIPEPFANQRGHVL